MKTVINIIELFQNWGWRALLLALSVLYTLLSFAHDFEVDGIYYNINGTEASVTYKGSSYNSVYDEYSGHVIIPSTVTYNSVTYSITSIGNSAFNGCHNLTMVTIPNSITAIGSDAFYGCSNLKGISLSDIASWCNISFAGLFANPLYYAEHLYLNGIEVTDITIPNSVTSIRDYAFCKCSNLTSVTIPNSVTEIGISVFYHCRRLTNVTIPNSVTSIGESAFMSCSSLESVTIPNSVTSIGESAFDSCSSLESVTIPNSVTSINGGTFYGCSSLASVTIPNSVTKIGQSAFYSCSSLTNANLPSSVTFIGPNAFANSGLTMVTIPNSVTSIGESAFKGCRSLASVTIPNSVTVISSGMFYGCSSLASVTIPNSVTEICQSSFYNCSSLTNANLPYSVISIGPNAFANSGLTMVIIPNSITSIGESAFQGCCRLASVTIPNSVTSIGESAFQGCCSLASVTIPNSVTSIGHNTFYGCSSLAYVSIPNSVTFIGEYAFQGCSSLASVAIPNSVTSIDNYAFSGCTGLLSVAIPNSVTSIGNYAFSDCGLNNVSIGNSVTSISGYTFKNCTNLSLVKLPKTLKSIGEYAFYNCSGLTSITIPESVTSIGYYAFSSCTGLTNVTIPGSVTSIGSYAFQGCTGMSSATIKSYLTSIESYAFSNCRALSTFTCMPETPPILNNSNSFNTYNTTSLYVPRSGVENYKTHTNWRRFSKIYEFVGYFTVPDVNVSKGQTVVVPVSMTNEADIIGFQTDIYLPEGFEFVKDGNDYVVDPSDRMARDHAIMCNVSEDGALRVLCYSPTNKVISGNEGELFYVTIKAPADSVGEFTLGFKNTILTTSNAEELLSPDAYTNINVIPYIPGDANGNGEVSVIDIVTSAQFIIFQDPDPFFFEAADLNNDEQITVTDLALIANLILYPTMNAPQRVPILDFSEEQIHGNDIQLNVGQTRTVTISLDDKDKYSAFQMDVKMPSGLTASNFKMVNQTSRHSFITSEEKNGMIRVLCYSPIVANFDNDEKTLLTFDVTAIDNTGGDIIIDGIELVTTSCRPVHLDALAISVNKTNSVSEVPNGKNVAHIDFYNLAGRKQVEPVKGVTIIVTTYTDGSRSTQKIIM